MLVEINSVTDGGLLCRFACEIGSKEEGVREVCARMPNRIGREFHGILFLSIGNYRN